jgi:hypothetical protein
MSVHLRAHTGMRASQHQPSQLLPGATGRPPAGTELRGCRPWSESATASPPGTCWGSDGVGTRITYFVFFHSDWSSLSKDSSTPFH